MKYTRLTKEQLEEMYPEFITFLATQGIDAEEWKKLKTDKPEVAEEEIDLFSDLVWEKVLNRVNFLEHISAQQIFLFKIEEAHMALIGVKVDNPAINLNDTEGYQWLQNNLTHDDVQIFTSTKPVSDDRNKDIFVLIRQGAHITKGELYEYFENIVNLT